MVPNEHFDQWIRESDRQVLPGTRQMWHAQPPVTTNLGFFLNGDIENKLVYVTDVFLITF